RRARERDGKHGEPPPMVHASSGTAATRTARSVSNRATLSGSSRPSSLMLSQNRWFDAVRNSPTSNAGWWGLGRPVKRRKLANEKREASSTASSNVMGTNAGTLLSGRPPTLSG